MSPDVAVNFILSLAVIIPIESIFVTSSYVNVPAIDTFPVKVETPDTFKLAKLHQLH